MDFLEANRPFLVSAAIIALGYALKRIRILSQSDGQILAKVALNITLPAVILTTVPAIELDAQTALLPILSFSASALMVLLALPLFRRLPPAQRGLAMTATGGYNIGLFAFPLATGLYGQQGLELFALLDVGNAIAVFGLSNWLAARFCDFPEKRSSGFSGSLKLFLRSIPFMSYLLALVLNLLDWNIKGMLQEILAVPASMNQGVALLALGSMLSFRIDKSQRSSLMRSLLLRYGFGIVAATISLFALPLDPLHRIALASVVILPVGLAVVPFSQKWGYDAKTAAAILNTGIPISFVLFWAVWAASRLLGI